ncbi:MAG: leucine-rich repeat protein [Prevotella sp.]|nr:leucine-rich repeat protein [Prevotella sp.]
MKKLIATSVLIWGLLFTSLPCNAQFLKKLGKAFEDAGKEMLQSAKSQQTASVKFSNLRLTYDQIDAKNGRKMLQVHYTLRVDGLQGHTLVPVLAIEIPQGTFHKFADGNDMKAEGNQLTCNYQSTTFNGQWQAIYIDALNPLPGKRTYYARIYLVDLTLRKQIAASEYLTFTNTGQQSTQLQPVQQQSSKPAVKDVWIISDGICTLPTIVKDAPPAISKNYVRSKASVGADEDNPRYSSRFQKAYAGILYTFGVTSQSEVTILSVYTRGLYPNLIEMPSKITNNGVTYIVTGLGAQCMQSSQVKEMILPKNLKRIGKDAFLRCQFEHFTIPSTVTRIDAYAFHECKQLREIIIPASVRQIGYSPFRGCVRLQNINVDSNNPNYTSIGGILYNKNVTELIQIPYPRKMETYIAPSTLVSVNREAIYTQGIRNFVFPNGLKYIAKYAFKGSNVNSIVIPASVLSIDEEAFAGCNRPNIGDGLEGEYIGKMIVTAIRPLKMHANAFGNGYFKNNPTLYVPAGSREDYLSTDGWSDIKNVIEVNFQYE